MHVSQIKPCYPSAAELQALSDTHIKEKREKESQNISDLFVEEEEFKGFSDAETELERQRVLNIFTEESEEEEFKGFSDVQTELDQVEHQRVLNIFAQESEEEDFLSF